jgi:hypothetical protein
MPLLAGCAGFFGREFMCMAAGMGGLATHGRNFALALLIHCRKSAAGACGLDVVCFHGVSLRILSGLLNG